MNYNTTDLHAVVAEIIAPEVVARFMAHDLGSYGVRQHGNIYGTSIKRKTV